jgi:hypothetical protein
MMDPYTEKKLLAGEARHKLISDICWYSNWKGKGRRRLERPSGTARPRERYGDDWEKGVESNTIPSVVWLIFRIC